MIEPTSDKRYVYGVNCTFHGPVQKVGRPGNLPCCPYCGGMLFEHPDKTEWDKQVGLFNIKKPGYTGFVEWLGALPTCYPLKLEPMLIRYNFIHNKDVKI